jgi:hypothetical protein
MNVPHVIQRIAVDGLVQMRAHPRHHLDWRVRRELYHRFKLLHADKGSHAQGWLAVLTAEHVLPIFTSTFPHARLPSRLLRYAKKVMRGDIAPTSPRLDVLEDHGYLGTGIDMIDLRDEVAYNAEYAGDAATDEDIAHLAAFSDTASAAALAYAYERLRFHLHPARLRMFWEWWVEAALPAAWDRV